MPASINQRKKNKNETLDETEDPIEGAAAGSSTTNAGSTFGGGDVKSLLPGAGLEKGSHPCRLWGGEMTPVEELPERR